MVEVPDVLKEQLTQAAKRFGADHSAQLYAMAVRVIQHYLGKDWVEERVGLRDAFDDFMLNERNDASVNRITHMHRVITLGDSLFSLQEVPGFDALCERFKRPDTKAHYFEAYVAANLIENGVGVEVQKEKGKLKDDFEFVGSWGADKIAIEVTAKQDNAAFSQDAVRSTLKRKMRQLPKDMPCILYVVVPESWGPDTPEMDAQYVEPVADIFRNYTRLNAVVWVWTSTADHGEGRFEIEVARPFRSKECRHQIANLGFLDRGMRAHVRDVRAQLLRHADEIKAALPHGAADPPFSFWRWLTANSVTLS